MNAHSLILQQRISQPNNQKSHLLESYIQLMRRAGYAGVVCANEHLKQK